MKKIRQMSFDISRKLGKIPDRMVEVLDEATMEMLEEVKANANYDTGVFVESFYRVPATKNDRIVKSAIGNSVVVRSSKGNVYNLGYLLENGTRPHDIYPVNSNKLRFEIDGKVIYANKVHHTGTRPYLFYYNALMNATPRLGLKISQAIKEEIK